MNNVQQLLRKEFELLRTEMIAKYEASGMKTSGNWAKTVQLQELPNGFTIVADNYIQGRSAGKAPPSSVIESWLQQKGIAAKAENEISLSSLAYLIARKIAREGWKPKPGFEDIAASVATPQRIQDIIDRVGQLYLQDFTNSILNFLKQQTE
ncbi:hypothetical protein [Flavobacterium rhizosphaerae]|uniref:Uncharacterized protein n=1 Tax=Flavobacterium rhizosphaerae TaxID=3163298 RepID=A0ABW8YXN1_9FLAO